MIAVYAMNLSLGAMALCTGARPPAHATLCCCGLSYDLGVKGLGSALLRTRETSNGQVMLTCRSCQVVMWA